MKASRSQRTISASLTLVLAIGLAQWQAVPAAADGWKPKVQQTASVPVVDAGEKALKAPKSERFQGAAVSWPAAAEGTVDLSSVRSGDMVRAGSTPIRLGVPRGTKDPRPPAEGRARVLDHAASDKLIGPGLVAVVETSAGTDTTISVDYSTFAGASGGGFGGRLRLVSLPSCSLTTPDLPECQQQTPVESVNDPKTQQLTATIHADERAATPPAASPSSDPSTSTQPSPAATPSVTPAPSESVSSSAPSTGVPKPIASAPSPAVTALMATMVVAAVATTTSDQSDYGATSLKPSATWGSGNSTGEFSWSYPLRVPAVPGKLSPQLTIAYSSGGTDGGVANTNNQASWVGEGFELASAFVERKYENCYDDRSGANNSSSNAVDLCWSTDAKKKDAGSNEPWDNAFLSMEGHAGELVRVANTADWRLKQDDGTRVTKIGSIASNNEYWRVTTPDGTQYYFGKGKADAAAAAATNSVWSVPVAANNTWSSTLKEPGYNSSFASSFTSRPWRWNLDYVVAPTGATTTYYYVKETNKYKKNLSTSTSYDRGGYLSKIQYGERRNAETVDDSPAKVTFTVEERCDTSISSTCKTTEPTSSTAKAWPDVPMDAVCATYCPSQKTSPTFFSRKRLARVDTFTRDATGTAWESVESWALSGSFPKPTDGGATPSLWLDSITNTGKAGTAVPLPAVTLSPTMLNSRISGSSVALQKPRLAQVTSETGAQTIVNYSQPECTQLTVPSQAQIPTNTTRCMPVWYSSGTAAPTLQWFNKYVVASVTERDQVAKADVDLSMLGLDIGWDKVTTYTYIGGGAWRYSDSPIGKAKYRTWSDWRGYGKVTTVVGTGSVKNVTELTYFRGMNGDKAASGTKTVAVTDTAGVSWPDDDWLSGMARESRTLTAIGGGADSGTITDPRVVVTLDGSGNAITDGRLTSHQVGVAKTVSSQKLATGGTRTGISSNLAWNAYGQPTKVEDQGDTAVTGDETCSRSTFATPADLASGPIDRVTETTVTPGLCAGNVDYGTVIAGSRHYYGTASLTASVIAPALETRTEQLQSGSPRTWVAIANTSQDQWGRTTAITDALGRATTTSYTDTTGGLNSARVSNSPDPDGAGPITSLTTTISYDTRWAAPVKTVQAGGQTTEANLDGLGRVVAVWLPGRDKATQTASATYSYILSSTTTSSVTTQSLLPNGSYATSVTLMDSLLRTRQTQALSALGGRLITDTRYDTRGNAVLVDAYYNASAPSATLVQPASRDSIPTSHRVSFDFANRAVRDALYSLEVYKWESATAYDGDRTRVTPPLGGTPTTTVTDIEGRATQLIQHLGSTTTAPGVATSYTYDLLGRLLTMVDAKGNHWSNTYNLSGNKLTADDPDKGESTMSYDAAGQLVTTTDARNVTLKYFYDNLGRQTKITKADGTTALVSTSYDTVKKGLPATSSRYLIGGTVTSRIDSYDTAGRATSSTTDIPAISGLIDSQLSGSYTTTTSYNPDGSINTETLPATGPIPAETLTHGYTATGLPSTLAGTLGSTNATYVTSTQYLDWGKIVALDFGTHTGKAARASYAYDPATLRLASTQLNRQVAPGVTDEHTDMGYDPAGNITQVNATMPGGQTDNQCFSYDYQQQLTEAWTPNSTTCSITNRDQSNLAGPAPYWDSWTTDIIGKTTSRTERTRTTSSTTNYSYPGDGVDSVRPHFVAGTTTTGSVNGTATYSADQAGNTTSRPGQTLTWDDQNQLTEVSDGVNNIAKMAYDANGNRILRKQGNSTTLYLAGGELTLTGGGALTALRYYSHAGQTLAVRTGASNDTITTLVPDWQGTTHQQMNNASGALSTNWQDPYGNPRGTTSAGWVGERGFVGGTKDATGLTRIGARDYDPSLQRFITVDPQQSLTDPLQWNPYIYANNTPITKADPTGLMTPPDDGPNPNPGYGGGRGVGNGNGNGGGNSGGTNQGGHHGDNDVLWWLAKAYDWGLHATTPLPPQGPDPESLGTPKDFANGAVLSFLRGLGETAALDVRMNVGIIGGVGAWGAGNDWANHISKWTNDVVDGEASRSGTNLDTWAARFGEDALMAVPFLGEVKGLTIGTKIADEVSEGIQAAEAVPDALILARGGTNTAERFASGSGVTVGADGTLSGVSVNSGRTLQEAVEGIPHKQVGVTTAGDVRNAGGTVIRDPLPDNPGHCLLSGCTAEDFSRLFTPTIKNPGQ